MGKIIVCNGGYRTGSTLSFNIVRLLHEQANIECESIGANAATVLNMIDEEELLCIAKVHHWSPPDIPSIKTLHTIRCPYEVSASMVQLSASHGRPVDWDKAIEALKTAKELTKAMEAKSNALVIDYESLMNSPVESILKIAYFLDIEVSGWAVKMIEDETSVNKAIDRIMNMEAEACPTTQLRKNHIGKYKGTPGLWDLPPEIVERIREEVVGENN